MLNPWKIEIAQQFRERIRLRIVNEQSGEIRQIDLSVDDIAAVKVIDTPRLRAIAKYWEEADEQELDDLVSYEEDIHGST